MKHLLILISFLLLSSPLFGQSERPETIIVPVSGIGEIPNSRKLILQNKLTNKLKQYFRIVPQEKYEQVLEQVFEELEYEECSEDTCIMRVQEMLQVENVFHLQLIGEGNDIQLNLKWTTLEEKRNEEYFCEKCSTKDLYYKLEGLVEKLVGEKNVVKEEPPNKVELVVTERPVVVVEKKKKRVLYKGKVDGKWRWTNKVIKCDWKDIRCMYYEGEIVDGVPNGKGTLSYGVGMRYGGEMKNGKKHGQGTEIDPFGDKYIGSWKNGKRDGQGKYTTNSGYKEEGEYKDGEMWNGTKYDSDGHIIHKYVNGERK